MQDHDRPEPEKADHVHAKRTPGAHPGGVFGFGHQQVELPFQAAGVELDHLRGLDLNFAHRVGDGFGHALGYGFQVLHRGACASGDGVQNIADQFRIGGADPSAKNALEDRKAMLDGEGDKRGGDHQKLLRKRAVLGATDAIRAARASR